MREQVWVGGVTDVDRAYDRLNVMRLGVRQKPSSSRVTSLITHSPSTVQDTAQYRQFFCLSLPKLSSGDNMCPIRPLHISSLPFCCMSWSIPTSSQPSPFNSGLSYHVYIHIRCDLSCCIIFLPSLLFFSYPTLIISNINYSTPPRPTLFIYSQFALSYFSNLPNLMMPAHPTQPLLTQSHPPRPTLYPGLTALLEE